MYRKSMTINDTKIATYQKGQGSITIIFIHGNSLNAQTFLKQFDSPLADNFKLIAFDLPGHGNSDKPANPEDTYNLLGYTEVLKELITKLELTNYYLVGHSLGGHIAIEASTDLGVALKGIVIFGAPPMSIPPDMENAFKPNPTMGLAFQGILTEEEAVTLATEYVLSDGPEDMIQSILNTDPDARTFLAASIGEGKMKDEVEIVKALAVPLAILHGENDSLVNPGYFSTLDIPKRWNGVIQIIANSGHSPQWEQPEVFNNLINSFILK